MLRGMSKITESVERLARIIEDAVPGASAREGVELRKAIAGEAERATMRMLADALKELADWANHHLANHGTVLEADRGARLLGEAHAALDALNEPVDEFDAALGEGRR